VGFIFYKHVLKYVITFIHIFDKKYQHRPHGGARSGKKGSQGYLINRIQRFQPDFDSWFGFGGVKTLFLAQQGRFCRSKRLKV